MTLLQNEKASLSREEVEKELYAEKAHAKRTRKKPTESTEATEKAPKPKTARKPRSKKPTATVVDQEQTTAPEEHAVKEVKPELPKEQKVLIMSCLNPALSSAVSSLAKEKGVEVVVLEDRVISDYLEAKEKKALNNQDALGKFLNDASNRLQAEQQASQLWAIITQGKTPIDDHDAMVFTRTQVVKMTNLSHNKANKVFEFLMAFGLLRFVKGNHEFQFVFNKEKVRSANESDIKEACLMFNYHLMRFYSTIDNDKDLTKEQRDVYKKQIQDMVNETIVFD